MKVRIALDEGTLYCTPSKGNCRLQPGDTLEWERHPRAPDLEFRLTFRIEPFQSETPDPEPTRAWPFGATRSEPPDAAQAGPGTGWVTYFGGTLAVAGVFEYLVEARARQPAVGGPPEAVFALDPMIIVGRR